MTTSTILLTAVLAAGSVAMPTVLYQASTAAAARQDDLPLPDRSRLDVALDLLAAAENTTITVDYIDAPLALVLDDMRQLSGLPVVGDWSSLRLLGVNDRSRVTLRLDRVPLMTAMSALVLQFGDVIDRPTLDAHGGALVLTTRHAWPSMQIAHVYNVRDIIAEPALLDRMLDAVEGPATSPEDGDAPDGPETTDGERPAPEDVDGPRPADRPEHGQSDLNDDGDSGVHRTAGPNDGAGDDADDPPRAPNDRFAPKRPDPFVLPEHLTRIDRSDTPPPLELRAPIDALAYLIVEHTNPEIWRAYGGNAAVLDILDGQLLITAPPTVHRNVRELLQGLRSANPIGFAIEASVVDIAADAMMRLSRRYEADSPALYTAILTAEEAQLRLRISAPGERDQPMRFTRRTDDLSIAINLHASRHDDDGLMHVSIVASVESPTSQSEVHTTCIFPRRTGTGVIELERFSGSSDRSVEEDQYIRLLLLRPRFEY